MPYSMLRCLAAFESGDAGTTAYTKKVLSQSTMEELDKADTDFTQWLDRTFPYREVPDQNDEASDVVGGYIVAMEQHALEKGIKAGFLLAIELLGDPTAKTPAACGEEYARGFRDGVKMCERVFEGGKGVCA